MKTGDTPVFNVTTETVSVDGAKIMARLVRESDAHQFSLTIAGLSDHRLRVTLDEVEGLHPRFRAIDALAGPLVELA